MGKFDDFGDFIGRHWGDFVSGAILVLGSTLIVLYACKSGDWTEVKTLGVAMTGAALFGLKLRNNPKQNGNGNGNGQVETK